MTPTAIIQTQAANLDTIIIWETPDHLVAFAYHNGRVTRTRPLTTANPTQEALEAFGATEGQITTIATPTNRVAVLPARWQ